MAGDKPDGIPLIGGALDVGVVVCFRHLGVMAYIIYYRFVEPTFLQGLRHSVNIGGHLFFCSGMAWLVVHFHCNNSIVFAIAPPSIWIDM